MQMKQLIAITYAISAASLAIGLMTIYTQSVRDELHEQYATSPAPTPKPEAKPVAMSTIVTAVRQLPYGHRLKAEDLQVSSLPTEVVPANAFKTIDTIFAAGKKPILKVGLEKGELLFPSKINAADGRSALSLLLPVGKRAVTIKVNEVRGVGGFIQPRDHVDILLTEKRTADHKAPRASRVLLQNVLIMAIGQDITPKGSQPKVTNSVTVAVDLKDAQKLALAVTVGHLSLALRNPVQDAQSAPKSVSLDDLQPNKVRSKPPGFGIQVFRSAKASTYQIPSLKKPEKKK